MPSSGSSSDRRDERAGRSSSPSPASPGSGSKSPTASPRRSRCGGPDRPACLPPRAMAKERESAPSTGRPSRDRIWPDRPPGPRRQLSNFIFKWLTRHSGSGQDAGVDLNEGESATFDVPGDGTYTAHGHHGNNETNPELEGNSVTCSFAGSGGLASTGFSALPYAAAAVLLLGLGGFALVSRRRTVSPIAREARKPPRS
jgi:hypothetical protein